MLFNSYAFLFLFLPVALAGYYGLARLGPRFAAAWLAAASLAFYAWTDARLIVLLGASIAFNFGAGELILRQAGRARAQGLLTAGAVTANLLLLFYYKYLAALLAFGAGWGLHLSQTPRSIVLPLGISFFTFTQIGYLIDCKAGIVKRSNLLDYVLFVTFFPHLIAGPILHHKEMIPQFGNRDTYRFHLENLFSGGLIFVMGLTKKVALADPLSGPVGRLFEVSAAPSSLSAWLGAIAYSLQLYFDFSGYSDMALGLARMFGLRFPLNFNSPHRAPSMIEFWQRWHMSLTRYLTLYLYNPIALAVARRRMAAGRPTGTAGTRTAGGFLGLVALPIFITMGLAGVWHGAGLQFLIFGCLHAFYLIVNHAWRTFGPKQAPAGPSRLHTAACIGLTYVAAVVAEIFFRAPSAGAAGHVVARMAGLWRGGDTIIPATQIPWLALGLGVLWFCPNTAQIFARFSPSLTKIKADSPLRFTWWPGLPWAVAFSLFLLIDFLSLGGTSEFLYFRF